VTAYVEIPCLEFLLEYIDDMDDVIAYFTQAMIEGRTEVIHYESLDGDTRVTQILNFRVLTDVSVTNVRPALEEGVEVITTSLRSSTPSDPPPVGL
jgi:hypothetical protein